MSDTILSNNISSFKTEIHKEYFLLFTKDNHKIPVYYFKNTANLEQPKAIIQIIHGMSEHHAYYQDFINYFNNLGFDIFIHDQRGHGQAVRNIKQLGYITDTNGGSKLISDGILVSEHIKNNFEHIPLILFGHSMGALVAEGMVIKTNKKNNHYYHTLILTGSPGLFPSIVCKIGRFLINWEIKRQTIKKINGKRAISPFGGFLVNYVFNFQFRNEGKFFAWATRDKIWLDKFLTDKRAAFIPKNQFWLDLIYLLEFIKNNKKIAYINKDMPIIFLDGAVDPVNNKTRQTRKLIKRFKSLGINNIKHFIYPNTRHHLCIEINRNEVFKDIENCLKF